MFSDINLLYIWLLYQTQSSGSIPSCFTGWFFRKIRKREIKSEWDNTDDYQVCSSVTIPPKALRKRAKRGSLIWVSALTRWAKLQGWVESLALNKPEERHRCSAALLLPWQAVGIALTIIPLRCFCFTTLHLTANNVKRSKAQHQPAERCSYRHIFESLKTETPKRTRLRRPRAGSPSPGETLSGDHKAMGKRNSFSRLTQHHL